MSAAITYTPLSNTTYLFASKAEADAFFSSFAVPSATQAAEGSVKKAAAATYTPFTGYTVEEVLEVEYGGVTYSVYDKASIDELKTKLLTLNTAFNTLLIQLRAAGILSAS